MELNFNSRLFLCITKTNDNILKNPSFGFCSQSKGPTKIFCEYFLSERVLKIKTRIIKSIVIDHSGTNQVISAYNDNNFIFHSKYKYIFMVGNSGVNVLPDIKLRVENIILHESF